MKTGLALSLAALLTTTSLIVNFTTTPRTIARSTVTGTEAFTTATPNTDTTRTLATNTGVTGENVWATNTSKTTRTWRTTGGVLEIGDKTDTGLTATVINEETTFAASATPTMTSKSITSDLS